MKLILLVVTAITIFSADSRDFPDKPEKEISAVQHNKPFRSNQEPSEMEERKGDNEKNLRGKSDKKSIKTIMKKLKALDNKLTQANTDLKTEIQSLKENEDNMTDVKTELKNITEKIKLLNDGSSKLNQENEKNIIELQAIKKMQDELKDSNSKLSQENSEINAKMEAFKKNQDAIKDSNSKLTQADSEINIKVEAFKKNQDALKESNSKLIESISEMKTGAQDLMKSMDSLKDSNSKLTQANSKSDKVLKQIASSQGALLIGGQYLKIVDQVSSWELAVEKCKSLNARLVVVTEAQALHAYLYSNHRGSHFWLGASDKAQDGTWVWINGQAFDDFPWPGGEPNGGTNENCLQWGYSYRYNDLRCNHIGFPVCEWV